ncbi:TIGR03086 family metal-binding protein [Actinoplanes sp. NPDC051411]|uniref:TIGR03086 family metal-binding protein n=1 Tax=Actinoplanes sp. NPDC051411 TaxID=3155522 RepID=UPI00342FCE73
MMDALAAGVAVLERSISYALGSLAVVTPPLLIRPTPCPRWDLRDLLHHFSDSMAALQEAAECGEIYLSPLPDADAVIAETRDRAVQLLGAWTNGPCAPTVRVAAAPVTAPVIAGAGAIEITVHGWDVAQACGSPRPIPEDLADELLDLAVLLIRPPDRPGRFARAFPAAPDAGAADRLLAFLGRKVPV